MFYGMYYVIGVFSCIHCKNDKAIDDPLFYVSQFGCWLQESNRGYLKV